VFLKNKDKAIYVDVAVARVVTEQNICKSSEWLLHKFQFLLSGASAHPHHLFNKIRGCKSLSFAQDKK